MSKSPYAVYMQSEEWAARRAQYFVNHERSCRACASSTRIELHHKTYARMGAERDQDLVALCSRCHKALHSEQRRTKENLWTATEKFIRKKRSRIKNAQTTKRRPVHRRSKKSANQKSRQSRSGKMGGKSY